MHEVCLGYVKIASSNVPKSSFQIVWLGSTIDFDSVNLMARHIGESECHINLSFATPLLGL